MEIAGTFKPLGALLGSFGCPLSMPRAEPVRRNSRLRGREGTFWRPMRRRDARRIVLAAKRYELRERAEGKRVGPLGPVAIEVLELLANLVSTRSGQLDPSIVTMKRMLRRSRDAIVRGLAALRRHGFIDWLRRYEPTGNDTGPQVRQVSNAYRLDMPERASNTLGVYGEPAPVPDDFAQRIADEAEERETMCAQLTLPERARHKIDAGPLADALARLGAMVTERESAERSGSVSSSNPMGRFAPGTA